MYIWDMYFMANIEWLTNKQIKILIDFVVREKGVLEIGSKDTQEMLKHTFETVQKNQIKNYYKISDLETIVEDRQSIKQMWTNYRIWSHQLNEKYVKLLEQLWIESIIEKKEWDKTLIWQDNILIVMQKILKDN